MCASLNMPVYINYQIV